MTKIKMKTFDLGYPKKCTINGDMGVVWNGMDSSFEELIDFDIEFIFHEADQKPAYHDAVTFQSGINSGGDTVAWEALEIMIKTVTGCDIREFCEINCESF
tara:strand:+ start:2186 stop:2488 length:303 start_codon:yes stop_codon:yes gene_type:complete